MKGKFIKDVFFEPGAVTSLTLIGLLLLGGLLYHKSVRVQRFLEPALALSQPKIEFAQSIDRILAKEFGEGKLDGVMFTPESILVHGTLLLVGRPYDETQKGGEIFGKLARVFISILDDPQMRGNVDLIFVSTKIFMGPETGTGSGVRIDAQRRAEFILNALYEAEPDLEMKYRAFFSAAAVPAMTQNEVGWVEFKIIPTGRLHIEVLQRLEKYVQ